MKSILRATAILGSGSVVSILVGLVSAKAWAILLGPDGLGMMGLLQSLVGLASLVAGMGIGTGLVRMGANALGHSDSLRMAALRRAAWLLLLALGGLTGLLMAAFRGPLSAAMLGGPGHEQAVLLMIPAVMLTLAAGVQTSTLNAHHRVSALARLAMLNSVIGAAVSLAIVWAGGVAAVGLAVVAAALVNALVAWAMLRRSAAEEPAERPDRAAVSQAARDLLRFGAPYTASLLVGTGVQLVLPAMIVYRLGAEGVGFYRAATAVSVSYLGFLLVAMGQDYYPRVSAAADQPEELVGLVNQQHRLVLLLGTPMILGTLALAPYLVPLVYSPAFMPSVEILEWQLIGDLFKFSSWTLGFIMLARNRSLTFFLAELSFGISTLFTSWLGMRWFGLTGLGVAFAVTYLLLYLVNWGIVRRDIGFSYTPSNWQLMIAAVGAALALRALPLLGLTALRTPIALTMAGVAGAGSLYVIWQEFRGVSYARPRRS